MISELAPAEAIVGFNRHPAAVSKAMVRLPAFTVDWARGNGSDGAAWFPSARFAPPGPSELSQRLLNIVVPLEAPRAPPLQYDRALPHPLPASVSPEPELEPAPKPEPLPGPEWAEAETIPAYRAPLPEPRVKPFWYELPTREPDLAVPPDAPTQRASGWPGTEPHPAAGLETVEDEFWNPETLEEEPRARRRVDLSVSRRTALLLAGCGVAALVVVGVVALVSPWVSGGGVVAVFNAPMMVVRAATSGRVTAVAANPGQMVDPRSPLLTIHTDDPTNPDKTVLSGVHGVIRSVETVPGADLGNGAPLVRIHDCDRAFLTIPPDTKLRNGDAVQVSLPGVPPFTGTVRASAGIMEPPDSLVIGLQPGAAGATCPVGVTGTIAPLPKS